RGPAYEDAQGGLWLPLNHGLARVEVGSALEYYDDDLGLDGLILSILRQRGTLYAGTTQGLFALEPAASGAGMARFVRVAGIEGGCGDLLAFRDRLLAATSRGVFEVKTEPPVVEALFPEASYRLAASRDGVRVYVGTRSSGLHALSYRDGRFVHEGRVGRSSDYVRHIVEDASGRLWLKAFTPQRTERIERVDPATSEVGSWRVTVYGPERGLSPREDLVPFRWRDQLFVGAPNRIYRLAADRFEPAPELEAVLPARVDLGAPTVDGRGRLWFYVSPYRAARAEVDRFGKVRLSFPLDRARVREYLAFHTEETDERSSVVWAGGVDGRLIRYDDESSERTGAESFSAMIRRVSVAQAGGALLFGGTAPQARNPLVLPYAANSLRFEYALPRFDAGEANTYQSRLVGHDETWSEWSEEAYRDFTALWEGRYRFEVRGRDVYGRNSEIASFGFRVLPPWYRAWWAMTLYGLAFLASMGVYVRGHRKKLEEKTAQVRERQRLVEELEAKNAELETFTYTVSHDLKSPLFTIQGFLGMLRKDAVSGNTEQLEHDIGRIRTAADQMALLLEDLLELSRVGRRVNPPEAVAFDELAREAVELVAGRIAKRDVKFSIEPELPVVFGDRVRLLQVLQNLIENAVRFMGDERAPRIDVGARQNGEEVIFFVQDNGIGIEPRYHEKIFGLFERLNPDAESTGVGLALVKRIVELHGGRVWVDSEGPGRGSRFCFTLPRGGGAGGGDG
ncbi:MAG: GHKL domain-containing protein, partial [bacterium]|nr:GHKL domain-containing protein [bacterium]